MRDCINQSLILDSLFTNWKFRFVFDFQLPSNLLYLSFSTFCYIFSEELMPLSLLNYCIFSVIRRIQLYIRRAPNFLMQFFYIDKLKIKPKYPVIWCSHDFWLTTIGYSMLSNDADYGHSPMWTKAKKITYRILHTVLLLKAKKSQLSTQKAWFSKAVHTWGIHFCSITMLHASVVSR